MRLLKLLSVLIDYPRDELWLHGGELLEAAHDPLLSPVRQRELCDFLRELLDMDPLAAQERWVVMFERGRAMSLLLFEHVHGESRDRGQAMVDLLEAYRKNGFDVAAKELPDYLPLVLEYLAQRPPEDVREWLHSVSHIIALIAARAAERGSPYAPLFEMLVEIARDGIDLEALRCRARDEERDDTPEAMDRVWEEEAVRFGAEAPAENCPSPRRPPAHTEAPVSRLS